MPTANSGPVPALPPGHEQTAGSPPQAHMHAVTQCMDALPEPVLLVDAQGTILAANHSAGELFDAAPGDLQGHPFGRPVEVDQAVECCVLHASTAAQRPTLTMQCLPLPWAGQTAWMVSLRDISAIRTLQTELTHWERRYRVVAEYTYDWESWTLPDGTVAFVSPACERITGYPPQQFQKDPQFLETLIDPEDLATWQEFMRTSSSLTPLPGTCTAQDPDTGETIAMQMDYRLRRMDGNTVWVTQVNHTIIEEAGTPLGMHSTIRDITKRKSMELELRHQALHDALTGLPNRTLFTDRLEQARMRAARRQDYQFAVCFLDLDRFNTINDTHGHTTGDDVLIEITKRIQGSLRSLDSVSRFGGDEFAILLEELTSPRAAVEIIKRIRQRINAPLPLPGGRGQITASIGVVLSPANNHPADMLLRNANIALHAAKQRGRDCFKVFTDKMLDQAVRHMTMEHDMRRGVEAGEFFLMFQPFICLENGVVTGFEALLRWRHPSRGLVSPGEFIPLAEETGAIIELGQLVLKQACTTWVAWEKEFPAVKKSLMSVNISARQFSQFGFLDSIRSVLDETGMPPGNLKLEVTETAVMEDAESSTEKLHRIKDMGIALSIDDFGTGYSSMSYLQRFPMDNLKIDLSFIRLMHVSQENMEIVKAIINLGHTLGMQVVAEGVEEKSQWETLASLRCDFAQGYFFSRPMTELDTRAFLKGLDQTCPVAPAVLGCL